MVRSKRPMWAGAAAIAMALLLVVLAAILVRSDRGHEGFANPDLLPPCAPGDSVSPTDPGMCEKPCPLNYKAGYKGDPNTCFRVTDGGEGMLYKKKVSYPRENPNWITVYATGKLSEYEERQGVDYPGNDTSWQPLDEPSCKALCDRDPGCAMYQMNAAQDYCWIKNTVANQTPNSDRTAFVKVDMGARATDALFARSLVFKRECPECDRGHRVVYYKRLTPMPPGFSIYDQMTNVWASKNNVLNKDFRLYGTWEDLLNDTNAWQACNYDDFGNLIGFPRDCGPNGLVGWQWNSRKWPNNKPNIRFSVLAWPEAPAEHAKMVKDLPSNGLVAWFPFDQDFQDHSGAGVQMDVVGFPRLVDDGILGGKCLYLANEADANSGRPASARLAARGFRFPEYHTISFWMCATAPQTSVNVPVAFSMSGQESGSTCGTIQVYCLGDSVIRTDLCCIGGAPGGISGNADVGTWNHVLLAVHIIDGNRAQINYVLNGQSLGTFENSFVQQGFMLGNSGGTQVERTFAGMISDLRIYNRILGGDEIQALANSRYDVDPCAGLSGGDTNVNTRCLQKIWRDSGCTNAAMVPDNYQGWWKQQTLDVVRNDMSLWASMDDDAHRHGCYGTYQPLVPNMSAPVVSGYTASASSEWDPSWSPAWHAFDSDLWNMWETGPAYASPPQWLAIQFPKAPTVVVGYALTAAAYDWALGRHPYSWRLEGSKDGGSTWDVLDTQTAVRFTKPTQRHAVQLATPTGGYPLLRLNVLQTRLSHDGYGPDNPGPNPPEHVLLVALGLLEFFGTP